MIGGEIQEPLTQYIELIKDLKTMTTNPNQVSSSLEDVQDVVNDYQNAVDNSIDQFVNILKKTSTWATIIIVLMSFMLLWLAIAQIGLLL